MNQYRYTAQVCGAVHEGLVRWVRRVMDQAGLQEAEIWSRFPPEGTARPYIVFHPYRVGPGPAPVENSPGTVVMLPGGANSDSLRSVPEAWRNLGELFLEVQTALFPESTAFRPGARGSGSPYPELKTLPKGLASWYTEHRSDEAGWVVETTAGPRARLPTIAWRPGTHVTANYLAVASDGGRGTTTPTSDACPLALKALAVLTTALHIEPEIEVRLPPRPLPEGLLDYCKALIEAWEAAKGPKASIERFRGVLEALERPLAFAFQVAPIWDMEDQEFATFAQGLQRPLEALIYVRIRFPAGLHAEFLPWVGVYPVVHPVVHSVVSPSEPR